MGMFEVALEHLNRAVELNPNRSLTYLYRGHLYDFMKEPQLALGDLNAALNLDPDSEPLAYVYRARARMVLEDFQGAADDCTSALERGWESVELYSLRMQANYHAADPSVPRSLMPGRPNEYALACRSQRCSAGLSGGSPNGRGD